MNHRVRAIGEGRALIRVRNTRTGAFATAGSAPGAGALPDSARFFSRSSLKRGSPSCMAQTGQREVMRALGRMHRVVREAPRKDSTR